jgi:hypothetical protein
MSWRIEILSNGVWVPLAPASATVRRIKSTPYEFDTEKDATEMAEICYPDQMREHRLGGPETVRVREAT